MLRVGDQIQLGLNHTIIGDVMKVDEFINQLPENIQWLKNQNIQKIKDSIDETDYYTFFHEWEDLNYIGSALAKKAETIVFDELVIGDVHKHYEHPLGYELSEEAKIVRAAANSIYLYVIYLQIKDKLSKKAKEYCKQLEIWIKKPCNDR